MTGLHIIPHPYSEVGIYETRFGLKPLHDKLLEVLLSFDSFCRSHGIAYSLADGTLLGALRHGDFIPWDDDADVMLTRPEYDKLRAALAPSDSLKLLKIGFLDRITTSAHEEEHVYLDLFVNDEMPLSRWLFLRKKIMTQFLRAFFVRGETFNYRRAGDKRFGARIRRLAGRLCHGAAVLYVHGRDIFEMNDRLACLGDVPGNGIYTRFTSRMFETNRRFNRLTYDAGCVDIPFRGATLMALRNADVFLREMFGDFESLPPEEARRPVHAIDMFEAPDWFMKRYNG